MRAGFEAPLTALSEAQVVCERIINTPTPFPYLVQVCLRLRASELNESNFVGEF
jgi:predicted membrane chloride channel (bestrophin family)